MLLEFCFFLSSYYQEKIKRKRKRTWVREIRKEENREFTMIYYRRYLSMIENQILNVLFNDLFSESSELSTAKTAQPFSKHFPPGLSLCLFVSFIPFSQRQGYYCNSSTKCSLCCICFPHFLSFS